MGESSTGSAARGFRFPGTKRIAREAFATHLLVSSLSELDLIDRVLKDNDVVLSSSVRVTSLVRQRTSGDKASGRGGESR